MTFKELTNGLTSKIKGVFSRESVNPDFTTPNGGFSGYHPKVKKDPFATQQNHPVNGTAQSQPVENPIPPEMPVDYGAAAADPSYRYAANYQGQASDPRNDYYGNPQPGSYGPQGGYDPNYSGYQFDPYAQQQPYQAPDYSARQGAADPHVFRENQQPQQPDNIRYFPGSFVGEDGNAYNHVERIAQLVSVSACFRIIEFMRNGESVIVNTESIGSDSDVQRCLDMLAGAAFTLGCSLTKITQIKRAYLIAPKSVLVMQDTTLGSWQDYESHQEAAPVQGMNTQAQYQTSWQQPVQSQQTGWQQPAQAQYQTGWQQPVQAGSYQTGWQQPVQGERYSSDTRKGVYSTHMGGTGTIGGIFGN